MRGSLPDGDPRALLATAVQLGRSLFEHCGDIIAAVRGAAEVEPEFADVYAEGRRRQMAGTSALAGRLAAMGALRDGIDASWAAGIIGIFVDQEAFRVLTTLYGWTAEQCEERLTGQLSELLLEPRHRGRGRSTTGR